jgi:NAD(P)-dependent dehydrogenase (short-subunit alcohol dehydrogenase family)
MPEFLDQVVLITGAAGALGEIVTRNFVDGGAHIVGVDIDWSDARPDTSRVTPVELDLREPAHCRKAVAVAMERHGRIDVLINLVGAFEDGATIAHTSDETWNRMMNINLNATFNLSREVLPAMLERGRGRIIAMGSKAGVNPQPGMAAYHVSKAALHALIRVMAAECKGSGVTVNAVLPARVDTPHNRALFNEDQRAKMVNPGSIAQLILFLASEGAAEINGALVPVYGRG